MLSFLCILCILRTIKLPAIQHAANKCGGRGGGHGGRNGRGSNARGCGNGHAKGVTPKLEEETIEDEDKEPLGQAPETIEDDIQKEKEKEKEANDKVHLVSTKWFLLETNNSIQGSLRRCHIFLGAAHSKFMMSGHESSITSLYLLLHKGNCVQKFWKLNNS